MTADLLREAGQAMFGSTWQSDLARALARDRQPKSMLRNIQRYDAEESPVPDWMWPALRDLMKRRGLALAEVRRKLPK
jgi:hypothetical protein